MTTDLAAWRAEVPALHHPVHGRRLAYLDNAATSLRPQAVIDAVTRVAIEQAGNVHRGVHALSEAATEAFEAARAAVAAHLGAAPGEVVFTSGTTAAINLVAQTWGRRRVGAGDAVVVTELEHHSNLVPWQVLCAERGAALRVAPIGDDGRIDVARLAALCDDRVRLIAVAHLSNVVGTFAPIAELARIARGCGARLLVDGAQAIAHADVDVAALGCDFYAFSAHKLFGPTGTGVLWAKAALLDEMPPWQHGGQMVASVSLEAARYREPPYRFEAGTPNISGVIGLGAAIAHLGRLDRAAVRDHEHGLHARLRAAIAGVPGARVLGAPEAAVVSFELAGHHPHDLATVLDHEGVAIRSGHHCAEPLHRRFGLAASARASIAYYNGDDDVAALVAGLERARALLGGARR